MHGIAQVVQQLANDLSLIVLLDPVQDRRVRWRGPGRKARFQIPCSVGACAGTIAWAGEFPDSLKKLPAVGQPEAALTVWEKVAGSRQYMLYCVAISACLCSAGCLPRLRARTRAAPSN
jgi:hypothetical protein